MLIDCIIIVFAGWQRALSQRCKLKLHAPTRLSHAYTENRRASHRIRQQLSTISLVIQKSGQTPRKRHLMSFDCQTKNIRLDRINHNSTIDSVIAITQKNRNNLETKQRGERIFFLPWQVSKPSRFKALVPLTSLVTLFW